MTYDVTVEEFAARPTVVVAATTTWPQFPTLWRQLLGEVWDCVRAAGIERGCRNVMLYRDNGPDVDVEVGVLLDRPCPLTGRVVVSAVPAGSAAMTVHRGPFANVGLGHDAVHQWCAANGRPPTGTRWEIYGPHDAVPALQWAEVYWQLSPLEAGPAPLIWIALSSRCYLLCTNGFPVGGGA